MANKQQKKEGKGKRKGDFKGKNRRLKREILHEQRDPTSSEIHILEDAHKRSEPKKKGKK